MNMTSSKKTKTQPNRRQVLMPGAHLKYSMILMGAGLLILAVFLTMFMVIFNQALVSMGEACSFTPSALTSLRMAIASLTVAIVVVVTTLVFVAVISTHRIFGPMVPITRLINEIARGNYSARGKLRKNDQFKEVMAALNNLAIALEARHGVSVNENTDEPKQ